MGMDDSTQKNHGYSESEECTGAAGSALPLILLTSMSLVWVASALMPWYSWIKGSKTSANTWFVGYCNEGID